MTIIIYSEDACNRSKTGTVELKGMIIQTILILLLGCATS